tara:strand:+ start:62 stop:289 length:228 start_codon:yes stop_codon:yes gene_type:complete
MKTREEVAEEFAKVNDSIWAASSKMEMLKDKLRLTDPYTTGHYVLEGMAQKFEESLDEIYQEVKYLIHELNEVTK